MGYWSIVKDSKNGVLVHCENGVLVHCEGFLILQLLIIRECQSKLSPPRKECK